MVFENRNKAYGAYRLRAQAGRRYGYALKAVVGAFAMLVLSYGGLTAYARYMLNLEMNDAEDALAKLRPSDLKEGYKVQFLATARQVPLKRMSPGAKQDAPQIVDGQPPMHILGNDGPISYDPEQEMITTPILDTTALQDESLPVAKQKIVPTEMVRQIPAFPGGPRAFMRGLDEHLPYPQACLDRKQQGTVILSFVVAPDGYATDFEVRDAFDPAVKQAAMNALQQMPRWKPGTNEWGEAVAVKITVPVEFKI